MKTLHALIGSTLLAAVLTPAVHAQDAGTATTVEITPAPAAADAVSDFGGGTIGFEKWCKVSFSAVNFRYQSASEVWIAMSDSYGPYPTKALAARIATKYLEFDPTSDGVKVVLFRSNQRLADATVPRPR